MIFSQTKNFVSQSREKKKENESDYVLAYTFCYFSSNFRNKFHWKLQSQVKYLFGDIFQFTLWFPIKFGDRKKEKKEIKKTQPKQGLTFKWSFCWYHGLFIFHILNEEK